MCLDALTGQRTLKADRFVWKWFKTARKGETNLSSIYGLYSFSLKGVNKAVPQVQYLIDRCTCKLTHYITGFHAFTSKKDALKYNLLVEHDDILVRCIVPKNNKVLFGIELFYELEMKAIVSPEIILTAVRYNYKGKRI